MAKTFELLSSKYEEIKVTPAAARVAGEFEAYNATDGFFLIDYTAADLAAAKVAALITKCEKAKVIKLAGQAWAEGEAVYYDVAGPHVTNVAGALPLIGKVYEDELSASIEGIIQFDGNSRFLKA